MKPLVISLGGSLINKNGINVNFLLELKEFLKDKSFVIVTGGGKVAREYQDALRYFNKDNRSLDEIGIMATKLNALLVSKILNANFVEYDNLKKTSRPRFVLGGIKPGVTTDYVSVKCAELFDIEVVINMSKIKFVRINKRKVPKLNWQEYFKILPKKNTPGMHFPFDVKASKLARKLKMKVVFLNNTSLLKDFIENKKINGTLIY